MSERKSADELQANLRQLVHQGDIDGIKDFLVHNQDRLNLVAFESLSKNQIPPRGDDEFRYPRHFNQGCNFLDAIDERRSLIANFEMRNEPLPTFTPSMTSRFLQSLHERGETDTVSQILKILHKRKDPNELKAIIDNIVDQPFQSFVKTEMDRFDLGNRVGNTPEGQKQKP